MMGKLLKRGRQGECRPVFPAHRKPLYRGVAGELHAAEITAHGQIGGGGIASERCSHAVAIRSRSASENGRPMICMP